MVQYPKGKLFEDFEIGQEFQTSGRTITESDMLNFAGLSGDFNPLHLDEEFAKGSPFKTRVPHGLCIMSISTGLIDRLGVISCTALACLEINWKFFKPVLIGDSIRVVMKVLEKKESKKGDRGVVTFEMMIFNQKGEKVEVGLWKLMMAKGNYFER
ncbi:MaoC family dehydratase N-terminal domain-containing protein [Candidatus Bathyarchaeota archaeon]|nr:MaoC family dehydratase N-terminal domain-containing protein [Candidatus Bathyarchaeota archaeon]